LKVRSYYVDVVGCLATALGGAYLAWAGLQALRLYIIPAEQLVARGQPNPQFAVWGSIFFQWIGVALIMCSFLLYVIALHSRQSARISLGCCPRCGYDLRYEFKNGCAECGWLRCVDNQKTPKSA